MAEIPENLFERLMASGVRSTKALAAVVHMLKSGNNVAEVQRCPHCNEVLRIRRHVNRRTAKIVREWMDEQAAPGR